MDADLQDMLRMSRALGADPRWVQGGGGNTSVKTDGGRLMYVKASGTALADMAEGRGYRLADVGECASVAADESLAELDPTSREARVLERLIQSCRDELAGRPSVEASLHALLGRCVAHTHPSVVNGVLCARGGREALASLFGDLPAPYLYVEYAGAGYSLARKLRSELEQYRSRHDCLPEVVFLENHGLVVSTDDADRAVALTRTVFQAIQTAARQAGVVQESTPFRPLDEEREDAVVAEVAAAMRRFYSRAFGRPALVRFSDDRTVTDFLRLPARRALAGVAPIVPDQVVYCRERPVWVAMPDQADAIQEQVEERLQETGGWPEAPLCAIVDGVGLFCAAPTPRLLSAVSGTMRAVLESLSVAACFGGPRGLDEESLAFLRGWEVERFRRQAALGERLQGDLSGKVAVVTGAGSGIGRGLALFLTRRGTHVVLADIDVDGTRETERRVRAQDAPGCALPMHVDVTSEESVRTLVKQTVRELGGIDLLVNGAGFAPVHPLLDFPLEEWRKALDVNLTGYFLMAREAARCMVRQGTGGCIINISSKTGLDASRHHSAYNATKAGEIHVARGWALELAEHGIRVNVVCPGNVFTESKIWNEDYVRALAQKRGLRPEDVIPYYINLTALKEEITWDDVGEAVAFLASERAAKITGQTLVVDAGQVFVR